MRPSADTDHASDVPPLDAESSRQGARNVAGVTFQGLVACTLLLTLPGVKAIVPEGVEDVDVVLDSGSILVQAKQRSKQLTLTELADALERAAAVATASRPEAGLAVVTDAPDLDGIGPTGWSATLEREDRVTRVLASRLGPDKARRVAQASHLVLIQPDLASLADALSERRQSRLSLTSHFAAALLLARVQQRAIDNRGADGAALAHVRQDEVDELLLHAAHLEGELLAVEEAKVVQPTRFRRDPLIRRDEFLRGVRAQPSHIAAGYAVPRPDALEALGSTVATHGAALIVGPSGSGKSTLMWQYAHATSGRCFTLNRLAPEDVDHLGLFLDLMTPEGSPPLVICADDVGTSKFSGWQALVRGFAGDVRIRLLATCREEFFSMLLTGGGLAPVVTPSLSPGEAQALGSQLPRRADAKPRTADDLRQLHSDARSLMMEFVHLATTNRHLDETLAEQVADLYAAGDQTALDILRIVAAADVAGAAIDRRALRAVDATDAALSDALRRLHGEFLVSLDGERVGGLHPLRSRYLLEALHRELPTVAETFARLLGVVETRAVADTAATALRTTATGQEVLEQALADRLGHDEALDSGMLQALLAAEAAAFARVLHDRDLPTGGEPEMAMLAKLAGRQAAVGLIFAPAIPARLGGPMYETVLDGVERLDRELEAMPDPRPLRRNVLGSLSPAALKRVLAGALHSPAGLSPLFASDAVDGRTTEWALTELRANLDGAALGEAVCRLARVGARSRDAVQRCLGGEIPALKWVLSLLAPTFGIRVTESVVRAKVLIPAGASLLTAQPKLNDQADLACSVLSTRQFLGLEAHDVAGSEIQLPGQEYPLSATGGHDSERLARRVFTAYVRQYQLHDAEVMWSRWLSRLAEIADRLAADVEAATSAVVGFHDDVRRHRDPKRWADRIARAARHPRTTIPPPPRLTDGDPAVVRTTGIFLLQMHATTLLPRQIVAGDHDEDDTRTQRIFFDFSIVHLSAIRQWLGVFRGVSALAALDRLVEAAEALTWLTHAWLADQDLLAQLVRYVSPSSQNPRRAVGAVSTNARRLADRVLRTEREALQPAVDDGWELHEIPASHRGDALPLRRWLLVSRTEDGILDTPRLEATAKLRSTPALDGRLLALGALPGGAAGEPILVWRTAGWQPLHTNDRDRIEAVLASTSSTGAILQLCNDTLETLETVSKHAAARRLGGEPGAALALEDFELIAPGLPESVRRHVRPLWEMVSREVASGGGPSVAMERDRHLLDPAYRSKILEFMVAAQAAAGREDAMARAGSASALRSDSATGT